MIGIFVAELEHVLHMFIFFTSDSEMMEILFSHSRSAAFGALIHRVLN